MPYHIRQTMDRLHAEEIQRLAGQSQGARVIRAKVQAPKKLNLLPLHQPRKKEPLPSLQNLVPQRPGREAPDGQLQSGPLQVDLREVQQSGPVRQAPSAVASLLQVAAERRAHQKRGNKFGPEANIGRQAAHAQTQRQHERRAAPQQAAKRLRRKDENHQAPKRRPRRGEASEARDEKGAQSVVNQRQQNAPGTVVPRPPAQTRGQNHGQLQPEQRRLYIEQSLSDLATKLHGARHVAAEHREGSQAPEKNGCRSLFRAGAQGDGEEPRAEPRKENLQKAFFKRGRRAAALVVQHLAKHRREAESEGIREQNFAPHRRAE